MKFLNYTGKDKLTRMCFIVYNNEFNPKNVERNLMSFIPESYKDTVLILSLEKWDTYTQVEEKLKKLPPNCVISVADTELFKFLRGGNVKLPKSVGKLFPWEDKVLQYFNFSSKSLYMQSNLEHNEKCMNHVLYYVDTGTPLVTELPRILIEPKTKEECIKAFKYLLKRPVVGSDIEATSLKFYNAQIVSISFAIDAQRGYSFHVKNYDFLYLLKHFFKQYQGRIVWHNGSYDAKVLAHILFKGDAREIYRTYEDTMFIHYMLTNSPERMPRDLGTLVSDLCGEYKLTKYEITHMMELDVHKCNCYNLDDARGTIWLYNQLRPKVYSEYFYDKMKKWQWYLTQVELAGMPVSEKRLGEVDGELTKVLEETTQALLTNHKVIEAMGKIRDIECDKYNAKHVKQKEPWEFELSFNPNSNAQVAILLFDTLGLTPVKKTPSGAPKTDNKCLKVLSGMCKEEDKIIFDLLETYSATSKMLGTFVKAVKENTWKRNGWLFLHGQFNLARVVSGRLSSSDPNLQNLPSGSKLSKIFKSIFIAPDGYLWGGADYASLEERVNTVLTKDPNKLKVYEHGYDGHSYRAFYYFPDELAPYHDAYAKATTEEERVKIINSIQHEQEPLRKRSKSPTFLLQYLGTAFGLRETCGFSPAMADQVYENYYKMYSVSADWLNERLDEVADTGYATLAYGLRIHCYGITRALLHSSRTPKVIQEAIRTLGNAIGGQSYGQMNVDAGYKFLKRVYDQGLQDKVWVVGTIHDATYVMWVDEPWVTAWVNNNLTECMADISELPELQNSIPFPADLDIYSPSWKDAVTIKGKNLMPEEIMDEWEAGIKQMEAERAEKLAA